MSQVDYKKMLQEIDKIVSYDWGFSVTDDMVALPTSNYKEFTQEQAQEMSSAIGKICMIAHAIHCKACQRKWVKGEPQNEGKRERFRRSSHRCYREG